MASPKLAKSLYRALLRWSRDHADVPISLRLSDISNVIPTYPLYIAGGPRNAAVVGALARWSFRKNINTDAAEANAAIENGLEALRMLNGSYSAVAAEMRATRADRSNKDGIKFEVGQVIVHKKYGYRAVVYGWDRTCERGAEWAQQQGVDPSLPFYYALPDERDCQRLFGSVRLSKYVCEDNMMPVEGVTVTHRALENYFIGYSQNLHRYIPVKRLQYEYPATYTSDSFEILRPVDSNLLAMPEVEDIDETSVEGSGEKRGPSGDSAGGGDSGGGSGTAKESVT